jgi:hypothetical protein
MTKSVKNVALQIVPSVVGGSPRIPPIGVRWAGEYQLLEMLGERKAFIAQLRKLGYSQDAFRVTVRRITADGPKDRRIRYNVFVDQLQDGQPYRGKAYTGGHGEQWIKQFAAQAGSAFPQPQLVAPEPG